MRVKGSRSNLRPHEVLKELRFGFAGGSEKHGDISKNQDLCVAVTNLISIEEHLAFTAMKTGKEEYIHVLNEVRKLRTSLMRDLLKNTEGELWCISKHLLSTTMRLMETANKYTDEDVKKSRELMNNAFDCYRLFWFLQSIGEPVTRNVRKHSKKGYKVER